MRRFNFYEREAVKAPALQVLDVTCCASGRGSLVVGDSEGHVVLVDRTFRAQAFQAHKTRINAICQLKNSPVLVTIGDGADCRPSHVRAAARSAVLAARERACRDLEADKGSRRGSDAGSEADDVDASVPTDLGIALGLGVPLEGVASALQRGDSTWEAGAVLPSASERSGKDKDKEDGAAATVKVWRLDQRDPRTGQPECVRTSRVFLPGPKDKGDKGDGTAKERLVTALAVSEDCTQLAVGCGDGAIVVLRGDLLRGERGGRQARGLRGFNLGLGAGQSGLKPQLLMEPTGSSHGDDSVPGLTGDAVTCLAYTSHADQGSASSGPSEDRKDKDKERDRKEDKGFGQARKPRAMVCLFVTTQASVRCFFPTEVRPSGMGRGWGPGESYLELGSPGAGPGCAVLGDHGEWVVGNQDGVFFYSHEERKGAYTLPGRKHRLAWFRGCLVAATEEAGVPGAGMGQGSRRMDPLAGAGASGPATAPVTVTIYDLRSKFVAYTMSLGQGGVRAILPEWGQLFVMTGAGGEGAAALPAMPSGLPCGGPLTALQLSEKDTASKVDTLCRLHLFDMALAVASGASYGRDALADISRAHGDHLYSRGDFDGSVVQYCRTIGFVEPSYVIRRFLDSARVGNLAGYLEALHASGQAGSDHTTLLLNCYTKMGAQDKLRDFIRGTGAAQPNEADKSAAGAEPTFDVRVAIQVLRDAGCNDEATWLAQAHGEHDLYLALLLLPNSGSIASSAQAGVVPVAVPSPTPAGAQAAIAFLRRLPFLDASHYARRYGRLLLSACPRESTDFLVALTTKWQRAKPHVQGSAERPGGLMALATLGVGESGAASALRERNRMEDVTPLLALFADHPRELKRFLEMVTAKAAAGEAVAVGPAGWHALLEVSLRRDVYVDQSGQQLPDNELARAMEECVISCILKNPSASYDPGIALVLCQGASYRPGCLVLYERLGMRPLVLIHYMEVAEGARQAGRHAEAKAARRELVRRTKAMTEPGAGDVAGPTSASAAGLPPLEGDSGQVEAAGLWISVLRYLSRSYLDATGAAVLPAAGAGFGSEAGADVSGEDDATVRVTYPGLTGATLVREREEQDALLTDVLRHLDKATTTGGHLAGSLPPLTVLSVLSECPHLPFGLARDFLVKRLGAEAQTAAEERRVLSGLRADTAVLQAEIKRLDTAPVVFQARSCRLCGLELDLPSVHFLCGGGPRLDDRDGDKGEDRAGGGAEEHTFHLHCVTEALSSNLGLGSQGQEGELECPLCAQEQRHVRSIVAQLGPKPGLAEQFFSSIDAAPDGFLKAAEYLSRGLYQPKDAHAVA